MQSEDTSQNIPLLEEQVWLGRRDVVTDEVRVTTSVKERAVVVEDEIERGALHLERFAVERPVEVAPEPKQDGDTLIISIVEERLVVEKRLFVIEELHITRKSSVERVTVPETLRTMHATIERSPRDNTGRETDG